MDNIINKV